MSDLVLPSTIERKSAERTLVFVFYAAVLAALLYITVKPWLDGTAQEDVEEAVMMTRLWGGFLLILACGVLWEMRRTDWLRTKYRLDKERLIRETSRSVLESSPWRELVWITSDLKYACFATGEHIPLDEFWLALPYRLRKSGSLARAILRAYGPNSEIAKFRHRMEEAEDFRTERERTSAIEGALVWLALAATGVGFIVAMIAFRATENFSYLALHYAGVALFFVGFFGLLLTAGLWWIRINLQARRELRWWKRAYVRQ